MTRLRAGAALLAVLLPLLAPGLSRAAGNSMFSNLANPAIGFNALMLARIAPDLAGPDGLQFQESELNLVSAVDPYWSLWASLVLAPDEVTPEEVYAVSNALPSVRLKLGRFKAAFGKHGQLHKHAWPFVQSPYILSNSIGEEGFGGMGLEAAWMTPLPWYAELTLGAYQAAELGPEQPLDFGSQSKDNTPVLGHFKNLFDVGESTTVELGASALQGQGADGLRHAVWGADFTLRWTPLRASNRRGVVLQGEYIQKLSYDDRQSATGAYGAYGFLQVRWTQAWWTGLRLEMARNAYDEVLIDPGSGDPVAGRLQRLSANIAWTPSEFSQIRLEFSTAHSDDGGDLAASDRRLMLQTSFTIGYHPAHAY